VYVACNKSAEIVEVATESWSMRRRWPTPPAPYNLAVTPDGRLLIATQKGPGTTSVWRLSDATLLADIKNSRSVASGVAVSLDSRYAFVTLEGVGGEPGTVDVIDLRRLAKVASLDMGKQAGGIAMVPRH
jgi:DNA-binding beta-propeller fold protein YncE